VWDLGPKYATNAFQEWLVEYDRTHLGKLSWLAAASQRDELGKILFRAHSDAAAHAG
jgi:hypothetical protein